MDEFMALGNDTLPILDGDNLNNVIDTLARSLDDNPMQSIGSGILSPLRTEDFADSFRGWAAC